MKLKSFLDRLDHDRIVGAIQAAEARSRGEIRVHASSRAVIDARKAAAEQFEKLGIANALLIGGDAIEDNFRLAARNIANIDVLPVRGINVYDVLRRRKLVLTKDAVSALEERLK